jgi:hypothetical protein
MIKIKSKGAVSIGTTVHQDGVELKGITRIVIDPIEINSTITATVTFLVDELNIEADAD